MKKIGTLPSGGECIINKIAADCDLLLAEGFIEPHFFSGFSGCRKSVLPGIASYKTIPVATKMRTRASGAAEWM